MDAPVDTETAVVALGGARCGDPSGQVRLGPQARITFRGGSECEKRELAGVGQGGWAKAGSSTSGCEYGGLRCAIRIRMRGTCSAVWVWWYCSRPASGGSFLRRPGWAGEPRAAPAAGCARPRKKVQAFPARRSRCRCDPLPSPRRPPLRCTWHRGGQAGESIGALAAAAGGRFAGKRASECEQRELDRAR